MAGLRFSFTMDGYRAADRHLADLAAKADDVTPAWRRIEQTLYRAVQRQFRTQGAYGGAAWKPLSADYAMWKAQHYPGKPPMRRTDDLYNDLTHGAAIERLRITIGTSLPYAEYHQQGLGHLPRRQVIPDPLPPAVRAAMTRAIRDHLLADWARGQAALPDLDAL